MKWGDPASGGTDEWMVAPLSEPKVFLEDAFKCRAGRSHPGAPFVQNRGISDNHGLIQRASNRYWEFRDRQPFVRWGTLSDPANSIYEEYVTGIPHVRDQIRTTHQACGWLCGCQYLAADQRDWDSDYHLGGGERRSCAEGHSQTTSFHP